MPSNNRTRIISNSQLAITRVLELIRIKQAGLCWHCQKKIEAEQKIVSRGRSRRFYYHDYCAKKLHII